MRALKGAMEQILDDKSSGYADTIKKLRAKYDFPELKDDDGRAGLHPVHQRRLGGRRSRDRS